MTTCNRCGGVLPATAIVCHHCGTPVMNAAAPGGGAGSMGARQRAQERLGASQRPASGQLSGFPPASGVPGGFPPPSSGPQPLNQPFGPSGAGASPPPTNWRAPSLIDPAQLPDWLNPATAGPLPRPGQGGRRSRPVPGSAPGGAGGRAAGEDAGSHFPPAAGAGAGPSPFSPSSPPFNGPRPPAAPRPPTSGPTPYTYGGRRSTDDLFASSSLIDQTRLPDWLSQRPAPSQKPAKPPSGRRSSLAGPRSTSVPPHDPALDANLPDWLRAMDPGAPPDLSSLTSGPLRSGNKSPAPTYRPSVPDPRAPWSGSRTSGPDPFSISQVNAALPPLEGFDIGSAAPPSAPRGPITGNPNPFAPRSPFSQPSRPGDSFPEARDQGFPTSGPQPASPLNQAAGGFSAGSLIEKDALPAWLSGPNQSEKTPPLPSPFEAASLVDEASLPGWLRSTRETEPLPLPVTVSNSVGNGKSSSEQTPAAAAGDADAADDEALPEWLQQVYAEAHVPPLNEEDAPAAGAASQKLSASNLVDERSVPAWIREAAQTSPLPNISDILTPPSPPTSQPEAHVRIDAPQSSSLSSAGTPPAAPISGNSLIDNESLPAWLRELDTEGAAAAPINPSSSPEGSMATGFSAAELVDTQSLPAWLKDQGPLSGDLARSLGPSASSEGAAPGFSAAELVDTQALPAWIKGQEPQAPSESFVGPDKAGPVGSSSGLFSAAELVDTQALPAWIKGQEPEPTSGTASETFGQSASLETSSGVFSAAELVDTQALPAWLKASEPGASPTPGVAMSGPLDARQPSSKMTAIPAGFAKPQTGEFSAIELVDTKALPAWMKEAASEGEASSSPAGAKPPAQEAEAKMAAIELVDTGALPAWLKGAEGSSTQAPGPASAAGSDQTGGFSAASLIDPDALPEWLRPAQSGALPQHPAPGVGGSGADWGREPAEQGGLNAATLIDHSQLPEWLRSQEGVQRPGSGALAGDGEAPQARVPHRPRLSAEPDRAPSQAAASVFSAVLGPTAGEAPRNQLQGGPSAASREMPAVAGSSAFGQPGGSGPLQEQEWGDGEMGGWNQQPTLRRPGDARGVFEGEQGMPGASGARPGDYAGRGEASMPPAQMRPGAGVQPGRPTPDPGYGAAGSRGQDPFGGRGYGNYPPAQQGGGHPGDALYRQHYAGWEGGPGYDQGWMGDDEAGPPSGVFAKLKRMLGFGR